MKKKKWDEDNPDLLVKMKSEIEEAYPNLHFREKNGLVCIKGSFPVIHDDKILDRFSIEIIIPRNYPDSVPIVRETEGRIPRIADRHMNEKGEACLFLPDQRWEAWPKGSSFLSFLQVPVHNYFLGQCLFEKEGEWPFGQWGHGIEGILEYYSQIFETKDGDIIINYLDCLSKPKIKGHWDCPCGSGKRLRDCHLNKLTDLRQNIPLENIRKSLKILVDTKNLILKDKLYPNLLSKILS
jgi:hypothetical protein